MGWMGCTGWRAVVMAGLLSSPACGWAHGTTAGDLPVSQGLLKLRHRSSADLIALFSRENVQPGTRIPRNARAGGEGVLLPSGVDGLLRESPTELGLLGFDDRFSRLAECIEVLDTPVLGSGDHLRVALLLRHSGARELRARIGRIQGGKVTQADGTRLELEGSEQWLHQALREVIKAELHLGGPRLDP